MNEIKKNLQVVILCAGEGSRFRDIKSNIPKSLIQIQSMDNRPILNILIDDLLDQGLENIIIILGFMGDLIESHISRLRSKDPILNSRIITIKAHPDYKKGPLYTFLTLFKYPDIIEKKNNFLVLPSDTVFDQDLLNDILMKLMKEEEIFQEKPVVFYKRVKIRDIKRKTQMISIVKTVKKKGIELLSQIEEIELFNFPEKSYMNQIIPIFFLNYGVLKLISQILKTSKAKKIRDILNEICYKNLQEVIAYEITSKGSFYDIDTVYDLDHLNTKKSGQ